MAAGIEAPSALYWRGRIYEDEEHDFPQAVNYYRALTANYTNYYYGISGAAAAGGAGQRSRMRLPRRRWSVCAS